MINRTFTKCLNVTLSKHFAFIEYSGNLTTSKKHQLAEKLAAAIKERQGGTFKTSDLVATLDSSYFTRKLKDVTFTEKGSIIRAQAEKWTADVPAENTFIVELDS